MTGLTGVQESRDHVYHDTSTLRITDAETSQNNQLPLTRRRSSGSEVQVVKIGKIFI